MRAFDLHPLNEGIKVWERRPGVQSNKLFGCIKEIVDSYLDSLNWYLIHLRKSLVKGERFMCVCMKDLS